MKELRHQIPRTNFRVEFCEKKKKQGGHTQKIKKKVASETFLDRDLSIRDASLGVFTFPKKNRLLREGFVFIIIMRVIRRSLLLLALEPLALAVLGLGSPGLAVVHQSLSCQHGGRRRRRVNQMVRNG